MFLRFDLDMSPPLRASGSHVADTARLISATLVIWPSSLRAGCRADIVTGRSKLTPFASRKRSIAEPTAPRNVVNVQQVAISRLPRSIRGCFLLLNTVAGKNRNSFAGNKDGVFGRHRPCPSGCSERSWSGYDGCVYPRRCHDDDASGQDSQGRGEQR